MPQYRVEERHVYTIVADDEEEAEHLAMAWPELHPTYRPNVVERDITKVADHHHRITASELVAGDTVWDPSDPGLARPLGVVEHVRVRRGLVWVWFVGRPQKPVQWPLSFSVDVSTSDTHEKHHNRG